MPHHNITMPPPPEKNKTKQNKRLHFVILSSFFRTTLIKASCTQEGMNRLKHHEQVGGTNVTHS